MTKNTLIAQSSIIQKQVSIGPKTQIDDFCVIGNTDSEAVVIGQDCRIRSHTVLYHGVTIGDRVQIGHGVLVREFSQLGTDVSIGSHSVIEHHVIIENKVRVHSNVFIPELTYIEENVWIGPCVVFTNARYPAAIRTKEFLTGVRVKKGAKIGAGVVILPGVTIGEGALIGAGAVVTSDVQPGKVIVGNPSRVVTDVRGIHYPDGSQVYE